MNQKHLYETTVIINASLEDPQVDTIIGRIQEVITKQGGEVNALNRWGRKRLTYSIKKKNNGYYANFEVNAPPTLAKELEHFYLLEEQIIRFLTIRLDKKALKARETGLIAAQAEEVVAAAVVTAAVVTGEKEALFNDEADPKVK